jgi:hypothetical protein
LLRHQSQITQRLLQCLSPSSQRTDPMDLESSSAKHGGKEADTAVPISIAKGVHRLLMIMARDLRAEFFAVSFKPVVTALVKSVEQRSRTPFAD